MTTEYQLRIYDGPTLRGAITDMLSLNYTRRVNNVGVLRFVVGEKNQYAGEIGKNRLAEVWRKPKGANWYKEETYIIRGKRLAWNGAANDIEITGVSGNWLLSTRIVAWAAGTLNRSTFSATAGETIAKTLVRYNVGAEAMAGNGRIVNGALALVSVEEDGGRGEALDWSCAYDNLLQTLRDLANAAGGDFNMGWTGGGWEFRWYEGQMGVDRTAGLAFSLARGNLYKPAYSQSWVDEKTLAIVGGQGEGAERTVRALQGEDWSAENHIETFVDARDVESGAANEGALLDGRGYAALNATRARGTLEFEIMQTPNSRYGVHYGLGDLATVVYGGATTTASIAEAVVSFAPGSDEVVTIGAENV